jgi:hypothetical protein
LSRFPEKNEKLTSPNHPVAGVWKFEEDGLQKPTKPFGFDYVRE